MKRYSPFIIETTFIIVMQLALANHSANHFSRLIPIFGMVAQSALTIVFITASPELKSFYFDSNWTKENEIHI